jgi:hypothetical protein
VATGAFSPGQYVAAGAQEVLPLATADHALDPIKDRVNISDFSFEA